jgi:hypothetical protein
VSGEGCRLPAHRVEPVERLRPAETVRTCGMTSIQRFVHLRDSGSFHGHLRETKMMVRAGLVMTRQNAVSRRASRMLRGMGDGERSSRVSGVDLHLVLIVYRSEIAQ